MTEVAAARELRDLRQMDVDVVDRAVIDLAAQRPVRLERQALLDAVDRGERFVELRSRRGTRHDVDRERVLLHALRERERHRLRVGRGREAARRDRHARLDEFHCLLRRHDLGLQRLVAHTIENINHRKTSLFACSEPRSGQFHKNDLSFLTLPMYPASYYSRFSSEFLPDSKKARPKSVLLVCGITCA